VKPILFKVGFLFGKPIRLFARKRNQGHFGMKYILRVAEYHSKSGSQSELLYTDDKDELFIGPTKSVIIGKPYKVEVGEKHIGSCYRHITSWLDE